MVQLYPEPILMDFSAYVGYRLRGVPGALAAATGFILPTFVMVLALSAVYFGGGQLSWIQDLFLSLEALVIGVLANVTLNPGRQAIQGRIHSVITLAAFIAVLFKVNAIAMPLAALAVAALAAAPGTSLGQLALSLFKIGSVAFGAAWPSSASCRPRWCRRTAGSASASFWTDWR